MSNPWDGKHNFVSGVTNETKSTDIIPTSSSANDVNANVNVNVNNNNHHESTITSTHLLAANFVPNNLRAINTATVSAIIPTKPVPNMEREIRRVFYEFVGGNTGSEINKAVCDPVNQSNNQNLSHCFNCQCVGKQRCTECPKSIKATREASFASNQVQKRLASTIPSIGRDMVPGATNGSETTQHYLSVFRELLQVEYAERRRLYEQAYNQYKAELSIPKALSTDGGKSNQGVAQFKVMGIADGRPSLRSGDKVLIRPHGLVSLPVIIPIANTKNTTIACNKYLPPQPSAHHQQFSQQYLPPQPSAHHQQFSQQVRHPSQPTYRHPKPQMVEVDARVVSVTRGKIKQKDKVLISWVEDSFLDRQLKYHKCNVRFLPTSDQHERCLTALNWLRSIDPIVARDLLFPSQSPNLPPPPAVDENIGDESEYEQLNANQARFVQMVTTRTTYPTKRLRPPMILTGPAGTGKTKALLAAILQITLQGRQQLNRDRLDNDRNGLTPRILVCTPSHTAADVITERLTKLLSKQQKENDIDIDKLEQQQKQRRHALFRLYDSTHAIERVPVQILPYTRQDGDGRWVLPATHEFLQLSVIVCTCQDAHLLFLAGLTNSSLRRRRNCLKSDTELRLRSSGLELEGTIEGANNPYFTHLFIDEAAQATEPESLIPMSVVVDDHPDATKVEIALCGDPRQLGPSIYSPSALKDLQRPLLERLLRLPVDTYGGGREHLMGAPSLDSCITLDEMIEYSFQKIDYRQHLSVFLNLSYRGHPSFLLMPSNLFYFNKLKSAVTHNQTMNGQQSNIEDNIWIRAARQVELLSENSFPESLASKPMDWPMVFQGVMGKCTSMAVESFFGSNCWCNHTEAEAVVQIIEQIMYVGVSTTAIGVMAAFRAQVVLIRKMLRIKNLGNVNVGMPEDYQSMERDVIILSLTRSNKELIIADVSSGEGLLRQPKRMNVALTRANNLLVVVGNPSIMKEDIAWSKWLGFCKENGLWYGETGEEESIFE